MIFGKPLKKRNKCSNKEKEEKLFKRTYNTKMEMKPENIPDELLIQAKVVCAQLLIQTNTPDIVQEILDIYMIGLDIQTMQAGEYKLLIQLDMEGLFSGKTVTTFRYIKPKGDILAQLRQWIDTDIETLYKVITQQGRKHTICMTTSLQQEENLLETVP